MRRLPLLLLIPLLLALLSCGQRKRDAAYYEQLVDSIRKAEQVQQMQRQAADIMDSPVRTFFDTLQMRPLPIQSEGADFARIGRFGKVPVSISVLLGFPVGTPLKALLLPKMHGVQPMLLSEQVDSITSTLYIYTLDDGGHPIDHLCLYEEKAEDRAKDFGRQSTDYYITSSCEVTLLYRYESLTTHQVESEPSRRYQLTADGYFQEVVMEMTE